MALQGLNGLGYASTLFLMAAGLTLIFGVTRIVNFAHGSFYMLGAMVAAQCVAVWFPAWAGSPAGYIFAMFLGAACAGLTGAVTELVLFRRMKDVPQLYQLVATFGLSLVLRDAMRWGFGPQEVFAPRFPGLEGSLGWGDAYFPQYLALQIALGPLVWVGLRGLLHHTVLGTRLRAATQDGTMLEALGVSARPLMAAAVVLGCALAGLAGALAVPREPANLQMDTNVVVETFVVVVTGGLGSVGGAFAAALLIGLVHALASVVWPEATLVLVFATMALVLTVRRHGLGGHSDLEEPREVVQKFTVWPVQCAWLAAFLIAIGALGALGVLGSGAAYWQSLALDAMILWLFGLSLQWMMAFGGLVSFGHAAFFGLGAYGAALAHLNFGAGLQAALLAGSGLALALALALGPLLLRSAGVYVAMLSLAVAQGIWAGASQWTSWTGGDNGLIGLQLLAQDQRSAFFGVVLLLCLGGVAALARWSRSSLAAALQAVRDAPQRSQASGLHAGALKLRVLLASAAAAGLAGALFAAHKGAVFPSVASVASSLDALLVVLLGGVHQLWGVAAGTLVLVGAGAELGRGFEYWRGALGLLVMLIMVLAPSGLLSLFSRHRAP